MDTKTLHFDETIQNWDEALPLGNGDIGCLIWNSPDKLRFSLDKGGIWDCSNPPEQQDNFTYADLKNAVQRKKQKAIRKKYDDCYGNTTPTKLPTGKLVLDLGVKDNVVSELNFETAEAALSVGDIALKSFVHAKANYGLIEINKCKIGLSIENPQYGGPRKPLFQMPFHGTVQSLKNLHYPPAEFFKEMQDGVEYQYFIQPTHDRFYGIITAKTEQNGKTLIAYTVGAGRDKSFVTSGIDAVKQALQTGYPAAFDTHKAWWAGYWTQSQIALPDKLLEKQWYLNNYLLASCSRQGAFPMPLQGVWTADNGSLPPWKGDYHHDLNTQMSYTSYLKANHLEQGACFIDYLLDMADAGRRFARSFYGVEGLCLPSVMDIEGHALGGWSQYALSPVNQLWLCQIMARYYYFTKDTAYLAKIYAYMQEVGQFLMGILEEKDGVYKLPLSTSPEIHDNSPKAWMTPNTNYDLALMRAFMEDIIKLSTAVKNEASVSLWEERLAKLEPLAVNGQNVLMLSPTESPFASHRHHSHCMSVYPLKTLEYTTPRNRIIIDSTIKDLEAHGISQWVGYSVGWMAQLYIAQKNGEKACEMLHNFFNYNCTKNGFHVNGDFKKQTDFLMKYRLFTLEGNFIAADAIQDMLLYSEWGKIRLFPAVPSSWKDMEFRRLRAYGGALISSRMQNGEIIYVEMEATADCTLCLENDLTHLKTDSVYVSPFEINLKQGERIIFST